MAFIATKSADVAYPELKKLMRAARTIASTAVTRLASDTDSDALLGFGGAMRELDKDLAAIIAEVDVPLLKAYAQAREGSGTYDPVVEYQAASAAIDAVVAQIATDFPTLGGGWAAGWTLDADLKKVPRTFTPAQTTNVLAACQAVVNAITV